MGVIIGGPSLEPIPLGLGLKTTPGGHHFESLGLSVRRHEEPEVSDRLDFFYAMREQGAREELEVSKEHLSANLWAEETDSEGEDEEDFTAGWMGGSIFLPTPRKDMSPGLCMADDVVLGPGAAAWIPGALQKPMEGVQLQILPNSCSSVCCANGVWDSYEGLLYVLNRGVDVVSIGVGDIVGLRGRLRR